MRNKKSKIVFTVFFMVFVMTAVKAQITLPGMSKDIDDATPMAPIDGLIGLTLLAGAFFGGKKLRNNKEE